MGINFALVNVRKHEFFDPHSKSTGYLSGRHPREITLLCCKKDRDASAKYGKLCGRWFGDPIYVIGDGAGQPDLPEMENEIGKRAGRDLWTFVTQEYDDLRGRLHEHFRELDTSRSPDGAQPSSVNDNLPFIIANVRKRQFFSPELLLDDGTFAGYLRGLHPRMLTLLFCKNVAGFSQGGNDWMGYWFGDPVHVVGRPHDQVHLGDAVRRDGNERERHLWNVAFEEYEDIS